MIPTNMSLVRSVSTMLAFAVLACDSMTTKDERAGGESSRGLSETPAQEAARTEATNMVHAM
jgi:hypothetical protein